MDFKTNTNNVLPTDVRENAEGKNPLLLSRRRWIKLTTSGLLTLGLPWIVGAKGKKQRTAQRKHRRRKRWPAPPKRKKPRFVGKVRKVKRKKHYQSRLRQGFYQNPKTKVIHYVNAKGIIRGVDKIKEKRLKKLTLNDMVRKTSGTGKSHVHYSVASSVLENAALNSLKKRNYKQACGILVLAIKHDKRYKRDRYESPSARLYDLLAGISFRYNQPGYAKRVRAFSQSAKLANARPKILKTGKISKIKPRSQPSSYHKWQKRNKQASKAQAVKRRKTVFDSRLVAWSARSSPWKKRWVNRKKPLIWKQGGRSGGIGVLR